jgi:hypothetical protein
MKSSRALAIVMAGLLLILLAIWVLRHVASRAVSPGGQELGCDASLWSHVYHPSRLEVIDACKVVEGQIVSVRKEPDGDIHLRLRVGDRSLLNDANFSGQDGTLVLEIICAGPVTQRDAEATCLGFQQNIIIPERNEQVRVTGAFVRDREHGWNEIHPVTRVETIP